MRKTKEDYLNTIKKELDFGNNFVDYFISIGLKEEILFSDFLYNNDIQTLNASDLIKPDILSKFPPIEKSLVTADENIIRHCFPNGYKLIESTECPSTFNFYFVLDNNHSSINYPQKYIACLVFYENVNFYKKAYKKYLAYDSGQDDSNSSCNEYYLENDKKSSNFVSNNNIKNCNSIFNSNSKIQNNNDFSNKNESFEKNFLINDLGRSSVNSIDNKCFLKFQQQEIIKSSNNINISLNSDKIKNNDNLDLKTKTSINTNTNHKNDKIYNGKNQKESVSNQKECIFEISSDCKNIKNLETQYSEDQSARSYSLHNSNFTSNINNSIIHSPCKENKSNSKVYKDAINKLIHVNQNASSTNKVKKIYAPKCICLVSLYPFCNEMMKILRSIYKFYCNSRSDKTNEKLSENNSLSNKPLEKIIENLTIEVPLPPRGLYTVIYNTPYESITFIQTKMNELPSVNIDLEKIFINFKFEQIFEIYKHLLLETRLIFFCKDMALLSPIIHGFVTLTYPFKYPFNFITVIPEENFPILDNITPFIFGINELYDQNFFIKHKLDISQFNYLVIDIDKRGIELNCPLILEERECNKRRILQKEFPDLPSHYKKKLQEKLKEYINKVKTNNEKETKEKFVWNIRQMFYQFNVSIFLNYSKYLNFDYYKNKDMSIPSVHNLFKAEDFIKSIPIEDQLFYKKFIFETQQFADFIYKRMIPKDSKEKLEFLLFDEHITEKNNRKFMSKKVHTYFLQTQMYDYKQAHFVEKPRNLYDREAEYFKVPENRKNALKYGVEIILNEKKGEEVLFNYLFFPTLMTDFFFMNNLKNYILPNDLNQDIEHINVEMVSRSHLSIISMKETEMENYIYLCWAHLWAMTFWYHDPEEKRFRFEQLLSVLDKTKHFEIEIFSLLFESIFKYGDESMHFELYQKMLNYKIYPNYLISTIHNKTVDKRNATTQDNLQRERIASNKINNSSLNASKNNELQRNSLITKKSITNFDCSNFLNNCDKTFSNIRKPQAEFRNRTIKSKVDPSPFISDKFYFLETFPCFDCQIHVNLKEIGRDFKKMLKDLEWARCPNCKSPLLPKLRIKYIKDNLNSDVVNRENNNDSDEAEVLYSPFYLKYNFNNTSFIESRLKLDLDTFKIKFNSIFWNSIWYFEIKGLPYDFLMPYHSPPIVEYFFPIPALFMQNIRLSYTKGKKEAVSRLSFDQTNPEFLIDQEIKSSLDINDESEISEHFRRQSKISTLNYDENRKLSFAKLLTKESTENIIYEALGIIKNKDIDENSKTKIFNESFIKYDLREDLAELNTNSLNKANIIDLRDINNSNLNISINSKYTEDLVKKNCINHEGKYNCSPNNGENEFYLEIENSNFMENEQKNNFKRHSCNNSSSVIFSGNSDFIFRNENLISESPQRPRKNTISDKTHTRLKNLIQNSEIGKVSENIQLSINQENRSFNLIDGNFKFKISDNSLEGYLQNKYSDENLNIKHFNSCDVLNINENLNLKNNINDAVLFTKILYDQKNNSHENKTIIIKESLNSNKNLGLKEQFHNNNNQICEGISLVINQCPLEAKFENINNIIYEDIYSIPNTEAYKNNGNNKDQEGIDNLNKNLSSEISEKICLKEENKKKIIINDERILIKLDESLKESEKTNLIINSKSFYKLKTINNELESNCRSSNFPDYKFRRTITINNNGEAENSKGKFSENIAYNNITNRHIFQSQNFKNCYENLSSIRKEIKHTILKRCKSLNYFNFLYKNKLRTTFFNLNEKNHHNKSISTLDDFSKCQHIINSNREEI